MTQAGDVILFRVSPSSPWLGKLIGWGQHVIGQAPTKDAYEHVALVDAPGSIIEAYWPRIRRRPYDPAGDPNVEVYRIQGLSPEQLARVISYASAHIGELYNVTGLLTFGTVQLGHSAVCSQALWNAVTAALIALCPYDPMVSPDDIAASSLLIRVPS